MGSLALDEKQAVAKIFNSALAAPAIGAAWELGIFDELRNKKRLNPEEYALKHNLHVASVQGMVTALASVNVLRRDQLEIVAGNLFEEAYHAKSLFHWITLGSGDLFTRMQYHLRNEHRKGQYYTRDDAAISYACRDINEQYIDPTWWAAVDGLDFKFSTVVDLGCGSGGRLMQILERYPEVRGIGVDIAVPSMKVAEGEAAEHGLTKRLSFSEGDVLKLNYHDEYADVDLLTSFMMGHDFWPLESCVATLKRLRVAFPKVRRFFLGDTTRFVMYGGDPKYGITEANIPVFSLGFEFIHAMMGVKIPSMDDWDEAFALSGWRLVKRHLTDSCPPIWVIFELEHA
jgi:SAM-dependent methyltransferase